MIELKADTDEMIDYLRTVGSRFYTMVNTMKSVATIIELETIPYVPLDTSALEQSFEYKIVESGNFIIMDVGFDAVDEKSGFHYALYQHEHKLNHPKRGTDHYLTLGIMDSRQEYFELIEKDYLSLFNGGVMSSTTGHNTSMSILDLGDLD